MATLFHILPKATTFVVEWTKARETQFYIRFLQGENVFMIGKYVKNTQYFYVFTKKCT